jgi:3-isopropylmalate/(R)-2-methylmalate dehydratase large subunit
VYSREVVIDVSALEPQIARPHTVDNVTTLSNAKDIPIQMVYLGTCTGGRVNDFHQALEVLERAGRIATGVKLVVSPASQEIESELERDGTLGKLRQLGAIVTVSGCGSCCGTAGPIPEDGVNVMSTANRNFKARMGNGKASIFLGSPVACAAAAVTGKITDPDSIQDVVNEN